MGVYMFKVRMTEASFDRAEIKLGDAIRSVGGIIFHSDEVFPESTDGKRARVRKELLKDHIRANSWIADITNTSMQTVAAERKRLEKDGKIPYIDEFVRRDGKPTPRKY